MTGCRLMDGFSQAEMGELRPILKSTCDIGQTHPAGAPFKECESDFAFESLDRLGDCWLRYAEIDGRTSYSTARSNCKEEVKIIQSDTHRARLAPASCPIPKCNRIVAACHPCGGFLGLASCITQLDGAMLRSKRRRSLKEQKW